MQDSRVSTGAWIRPQQRAASRARVWLLLGSLLLLGCGQQAMLQTGAAENAPAALQQLESCEAVEAAVRHRLFQSYDTALLENLERVQDWFDNREHCCSEAGTADPSCVHGVYHQGSYYPGSGGGGAECAGGMCGVPNNSGGGGASEYSETNNQVEGVHEADFIKNDGNHVYLLSGQELVIFDAWPAPQTSVLSRHSFVGEPRTLLVDGDRAVIFSAQAGDCAVDGHGEELIISVLDISERSAPWLVREIWLNGGYQQARRIDSAVHAVVAYPGLRDHSLSAWPVDLSGISCGTELSRREVTDAFFRQRWSNWQEVNGLDVAALLPRGRDVAFDATGASLRDEALFPRCRGYYQSRSDAGLSFLSVLSLSLTEDRPVRASSVLSNPGVVYASSDSLYIAIEEELPYEPGAGYYGRRERTLLHKLSLDNVNPGSRYRASGEVPGRLLNQFSMDEYAGMLRVATTEGHLPDPDTSNNVFVLQELGGAEQSVAAPGMLQRIGALTDIAPTEDIRSARFSGPRGFLVTFKKTDPLFVFDLSDPTAPRVEGELHIPGFSTYMHFLDSNHLLSIGFDADDQGSFAWFTGILLQIFDVGDPTNPRLLHREVIGSRGSTSDATGDHLAFNYFAARGLLAVPVGICEESSGGGDYGDVMTFNGLLVYRADADTGFTPLGGVDHRQVDESAGSYSCGNWWTNPNSQVKRSVFMEDYVYSFSQERMKVSALADLSSDLVSLELPQLDPAAAFCW